LDKQDIDIPIMFRNDDVCSNTNMKKMAGVYDLLKTYYPSCRIINGITICSRNTNRGSVYDEVPFKNNPVKWFYDIDKFLGRDFIDKLPYENASHGLFHVNHAKLHYDAQLMSIMSSCSYLKTTVFIPPFDAWNEDTEYACYKSGVKMLSRGKQEWKSLEYEPFDSSHKLWYFHSWRMTIGTLREQLGLNVGQLQRNAA